MCRRATASTPRTYDGASIAKLAREHAQCERAPIVGDGRVRLELTVSLRRKSGGQLQVAYWEQEGDMQLRTRNGAVLDASLFEVIVDNGALGFGAANGTHSPQCELAKSPDGAGADARVQDAPEAPAGRSTPPTATRDSSNRKRQRRL